MVLLDSDHMSLLQRGGLAGQQIKRRLDPLPTTDVATTIVCYEEQTRGCLARIAKAPSLDRLAADYRELKVLLERYWRFPVLGSDTEAAVRFQQLKQAPVRIGSMDLRIAAIALAKNATLLTRNLIDFSKVPGLEAEDWSV